MQVAFCGLSQHQFEQLGPVILFKTSQILLILHDNIAPDKWHILGFTSTQFVE